MMINDPCLECIEPFQPGVLWRGESCEVRTDFHIYDGLSEIGMGLGLALVYCCCIYHYEMGAEWLVELNSED